ncbi:MAG TPA: hypothetical protein VH724_15125 [Candidatus Angelobacter sp.]|nr:hypothetical protein [Candidatus Angelobacter sp.]
MPLESKLLSIAGTHSPQPQPIFRPPSSSAATAPQPQPLFGSPSSSSTTGPQTQPGSMPSRSPAAHRVPAEEIPRPPVVVLVSCVYLALQCSHCGELRQALQELPASSTISCPVCGTSCSFITLGRGLTKNILPFHEIHNAPKPYRGIHLEDKGPSP